MLKIVLVPNSVLTSHVQPVTVFNSELLKLISEMKETLRAQIDPMGVGLAAPQVGKSIALFIMKPTRKADISVYINPKILEIKEIKKRSAKKSKKTPLEGCLSIPRIWGPVKRSKKLHLQYQTETGEQKQEWISGFEAVIIQHEIDHLHGVLFTQRALEQKTQLYEENDGKLHKMEY